MQKYSRTWFQNNDRMFNMQTRSAYEINRHFFYALRIGNGSPRNWSKWCEKVLWDSFAFSDWSTYDKIVSNIHTTSFAVCNLLFRNDVKEEQELTLENNQNDCNKLTVSGDGMWKKREFTTLLGVLFFIGWFSGNWLSKTDTAKYEEKRSMSKSAP